MADATPPMPGPVGKPVRLESFAEAGFHIELRQLMEEGGWTATRLGRAMGLGASTVSNWRRTGAYPQPRQLPSLTAVLAVSPDMAAGWQAEIAAAFRDLRPAVRALPQAPRTPPAPPRPCMGPGPVHEFVPRR